MISAILVTLLMTAQPPASLWTIIAAQSGAIAWIGKRVFVRLKDCEEDRESLHKKINKVAVAFAAETGHTIKLDED